MTKKRPIAVSSIALAAGAMLAVAAPLAASAHVEIGPDQANPGDYLVLTVRVPNEEPSAVTTKIELDLPTATPFAEVSYVPVPGWNVQVIDGKLPKPIKDDDGEVTEAPLKVIWTAEPGSEIASGQTQLFPLSVGPVPNTGTLLFQAHQTYSDGTVVNWVDKSDSAEHPAPRLYVDDTPPAPAGVTTAPSVTAAEAAASASSSDDLLARVFGAGGLIIGVVALIVAIVGRRKATS